MLFECTDPRQGCAGSGCIHGAGGVTRRLRSEGAAGAGASRGPCVSGVCSRALIDSSDPPFFHRMARDQRAAELLLRRTLDLAALVGMRTTRMKAAAARRVQRVRHLALHWSACAAA